MSCADTAHPPVCMVLKAWGMYILTDTPLKPQPWANRSSLDRLVVEAGSAAGGYNDEERGRMACL